MMNTDAEIRRLTREVRMLNEKVQQLIDEKSKSRRKMTVTEYAKMVGCSKGTVINRIKAGIYGAEKHGKLWYLPEP